MMTMMMVMVMTVMFQVSSAHVYLRLAPGQTLDSVRKRVEGE